MQQDDAMAASAGYGPLLRRLAGDPSPIVEEVVRDVLRPGEDAARVRGLVDPVVRRLLATLGHELPPTEIRRLEAEGAAAARAGERVGEPIDRYLSAGWAIWDAATQLPEAGPEALTALGSALLRSGDRAAAALAEGHGAAERRTAAARRALVDDLLQLDPSDAQGLARLRLRSDAIGIRPSSSYRPVVAWLGRELDDATVDLDRIVAGTVIGARPVHHRRPVPATPSERRRSEASGRPPPLPADPLGVVRAGRLVLLVPADRFDADVVARTLQGVAEDRHSWVGAVGPVVGAGAVGDGVAVAGRALDLALRVGHSAALLDQTAVALEAVLLADPVLLQQAVDRELGAIMTMPRKADTLLQTLRVHLEQGQNIRATARTLGVAPRTVAYRIERIQTALGRPLEGPVVLRLATALQARALLEPQPAGGAATE